MSHGAESRLWTSCPDRHWSPAALGHWSSALVYLYAGLRSGASADEVLARAEADGAPFTQAEPLKA